MGRDNRRPRRLGEDDHHPGRTAGERRDQAALAAAYDREWSAAQTGQPYHTFWRFRPSARDAIERALGPLNGQQILELGAGDGFTTLRLARRGARVIALELSHGWPTNDRRTRGGCRSRRDGRATPCRRSATPLADSQCRSRLRREFPDVRRSSVDRARGGAGTEAGRAGGLPRTDRAPPVHSPLPPLRLALSRNRTKILHDRGYRASGGRISAR